MKKIPNNSDGSEKILTGQNGMSNRCDTTEVGLQGFKCPKADGGPVKFYDVCLKCQDPCYPLPLLKNLMSDRVATPGVYHTTGILSPPQIIYLTRHFPYYVEPESKIWATFGRGWHTVIERQDTWLAEQGLDKEYLIEQPFEVEIKTDQGPALLRGKPDLYIVSKRRLLDWKTMGSYFVRKARKGDWGDSSYQLQLNIYRIYKYPETIEMELYCLIKDWSRRLRKSDGLNPIERLQVPLLPNAMVEGFVKTTINYLLLCEKEPDKVRPCLDSEKWIQGGYPIRCMEYCDAKDLCPQLREWKEANERQAVHPKK